MAILSEIMQGLLDQSMAVGEIMQSTEKTELQLAEEEKHLLIAAELNAAELQLNKLKAEIYTLKMPFMQIFSTFYDENFRLNDALAGFEYHYKRNEQQSGTDKFLKNLARSKKRSDLSINPEIPILEAQLAKHVKEAAKKGQQQKASTPVYNHEESTESSGYTEEASKPDSYKAIMAEIEESESNNTESSENESDLEKQLEQLYQEDKKTARLKAVSAEFGDSIEKLYFAISLEDRELRTLNSKIRGLKKRLKSSEERIIKPANNKYDLKIRDDEIEARGLEYARVSSSLTYVARLKPWSSKKIALMALTPLNKVYEDNVVEAFLEMLEQRMNGFEFHTQCSEFNKLANRIKPEQAALVLQAVAENEFISVEAVA